MMKKLLLAALVGSLALFTVAGVTTASATNDECVPIAAQHYSYVGGPIEGNPTSTPPGEDWQANTTQEPHLNNPNVTWVDGFGVGLHYTGEPGKANFFYFQPAVTCDDEPVEVTAGVTFIDPTCDVDASYAVTEIEGVDYTLEGIVGPGETVTVTASEDSDDIVLVGETEFTHTFGEVPTNCGNTGPGPDWEPDWEPTPVGSPGIDELPYTL